MAAARLEGKLDEGWHLYSLTTPPGGPNPTKITLAADNPIADGIQIYQPKPETKFDQGFNLDTETYSEDPAFLLRLRVKKAAPAGDAQITVQMRYQACTNQICLPPVTKTAALAITIELGAPDGALVIPAGYIEVKPKAVTAAVPAAGGGSAPKAPPQDLIPFLAIAFGLGLAAIFTPCVFPMIPITMSFFLNRQSGSRRESILQATVFSLGIIVLFCLLGAGITAIVGPFGVVQLGSNPWVNGFIAAVFLVFGLSLLGAFEITLPSGLLTTLNQASNRGGYLGTLLMGLTFSLTSFACVGPFVGTLLAASVQGQLLQPVLGMVFFATGLALPFFLLALFPSYLQRLPRSGGWLARVKVVMGFIIIAAMLKYLSQVDQVLQWNVITRERFLAVWFVLFMLPGLYLLGFLRLEGIKADERLGVVRMLIAVVFLAFAVSLIPGMFGGHLGEVDAFVPLATVSASSGGEGAGTTWMKNQYQEALAKAKAENKLVLINFTGYACTNCHWMKSNMFPKPLISAALKDLVLVELYTDGTDDVSKANQDLEEKKFSTVAIPFYAIVDGDGNVVKTFPGLTKDEKEFLAFLKSTPAAG